VFTVSGQPGQPVTLALESDSATVGVDTGSTLQYFDGKVWQDYVAGSVVSIPAGGTTLLVRTSIINDGIFEGSETFRLKVSNTGGKAFAGTASIVDDGSSALVFTATNRSGVAELGTADDDQPKPVVAVVVVPQVSAPVPTPALPVAERATVPVATFDSTLRVSTQLSVPTVERAAPVAEMLTSASGFRVTVTEAPTPALIVFRGITDQFVEGNKAATFAIPADAFAHTQSDAVIMMSASQANGRPLPTWVQFDARTGVFRAIPPPGLTGELQIKIVARDSEGREAVSIFKFSVGKGTVRTSGRSSLSEQIRLSAKRSAPWLERVQLQSSASLDKGVTGREQSGVLAFRAHG
jgi:hypothetical protein